MYAVNLTTTMASTKCVIYQRVALLPSCCAPSGYMRDLMGIRGDGAERWQVVIAVGFGRVGMKRGEALGQLLDEGQLDGVTFTDGTSRQSMGAPFVIRAMLNRSEGVLLSEGRLD